MKGEAFVPLEHVRSGGKAAHCNVASTVDDRHPWLHLIDGERPLALFIDSSRLYEIDKERMEALRSGETDAWADMHALQSAPVSSTDDEWGAPVSLSLNVVQACNLACHYCYADEGRFHGDARRMDEALAFRAIDRLFDEANGRRVTIGFIGGEPFLHRELVQRCVTHARSRASSHSIPVSFSVTTNATLLTPHDLAMLSENAFAVTVSLDGDAATHDRHRPRASGGGSFDSAIAAISPLLRSPGRARVVARVTVTRDDMRVWERIRPLLDAGFLEAGVSPARTGPQSSLVMREQDWLIFLAEMKRAACLDMEQFRAQTGFPALRFSNLAIALKEIHRGTNKTLPCGAAQSYVSVGADGRYYTCHRTVGQSEFAMGDISHGISEANRRAFLSVRHVDRQTPCQTCWARYLCGGGCHAEVAAVGREGCEYIRGWLEFCLVTYNQWLDEFPNYFQKG